MLHFTKLQIMTLKVAYKNEPPGRKHVPQLQEEKLVYYFQSGTCLVALKPMLLLRFLWSFFCKWPVINVTLLTMILAVHKIQD